MKPLAKILQILFSSGRFVTVQQLYDAASSEELVVVVAPRNGWSEREGSIKLCNESTSIFYLKTDRPDGKLIETIDIIATEYHGGAFITFVDGEIVAFTHNAILRNITRIDMNDARCLNQILFRIRHATK